MIVQPLAKGRLLVMHQIQSLMISECYSMGSSWCFCPLTFWPVTVIENKKDCDKPLWLQHSNKMHSIIHSHFCILYFHHDMTRTLLLSVWKMFELLFMISCAYIALHVVYITMHVFDECNMWPVFCWHFLFWSLKFNINSRKYVTTKYTCTYCSYMYLL